jgi:hypothetical protein
VKFKDAEKQLDKELRQRYQHGSFISSFWLRRRMRQLVKQINGIDFAADRHWRQRFRRRYKWALRVVSNRKRMLVKQRLPALLNYLQRFRQMISKPRSQCKNQWCETYGNYPLTHRWNVDQVPLAFVLGMIKSMAPKGAERVHVVTPSAALLKRQATLQVLVRGDGKQYRLAIIFRGKGNISEEERRMLNELGAWPYLCRLLSNH